VRDHPSTPPAQARQLARDRYEQSHPAAELGARRKAARPRVGRKRILDDAIGDDDDLVDATRERRHLRDDDAEVRIVWVELLGDEDDSRQWLLR
jgi:hypothetical protein